MSTASDIFEWPACVLAAALLLLHRQAAAKLKGLMEELFWILKTVL